MATWDPELERLLLRQLLASWSMFNDDLFGGVMRPVVFTLDDTRHRLGEWRRAERAIGISLPLVRERPWHVVRAVLKHEMAHQYVDEVLGRTDETAHGRSFVDVCRARRIDARATGIPDGEDADADALDDDSARVMRRVQKLLALAQSDNQHEAEAAAQAAQRLMLEHNLVVVGRAGDRRYRTKRLAGVSTRLSAHEKILAGLLSAHYFVEVVLARAYMPELGRDGFIVELSGTPENLAMAEWIHAFLLGAGDRAFADAVRGGQCRPADRRRFLTGFMGGVREKLQRDQRRHESQGLIWRGDADLRAFVRQEHPRLSTSRVSAVVDEAHQAGRDAGRQVTIAKPVEHGDAQRGRQLPPRR